MVRNAYEYRSSGPFLIIHELSRYEVYQGGHILKPDFITSATLNLPDSEGNPFSQYTIVEDMQIVQSLPYPLEQRQIDYASGVSAAVLREKIYGPSAQVIEYWLMPEPGEVIDYPPKVLDGSANYEILTAFLSGKDTWYNENTKTRLEGCRNKAWSMIYEIHFGQIDENSDDLQKILYNVYLAQDKDYEYLEQQGIILDEQQRKDLEEMTESMNVFEAYGWKQGEAHGWEKGTAHGKEEERKSLLEAAKDKGPEVYQMLQQLIAEANADSKQ